MLKEKNNFEEHNLIARLTQSKQSGEFDVAIKRNKVINETK